ncbi:cutinase family protein [Actinocrispum sp. NPDC049592]|uniref:cutinase family protein n=1 Tax=Actinocrispum sp. NPDC049592 TaxID=3154835 RepID=UPI0034441EAB
MSRILRVVLVLVLLSAGVAVVPRGAFADVPPCSPRLIIGARGSGEHQDVADRKEDRVGQYAQRALNLLPADTTYYALPYRAIEMDAWTMWSGNFRDSYQAGADLLYNLVRDRIARCPGIQIGLIGYSQGSMVVHTALEQLSAGQRTSVRSVLLLANPFSVGASSYSVYFDVLSGSIWPVQQGNGGVLGRASLPGDIQSRSTELCLTGDPVCDNTSTLSDALWNPVLGAVLGVDYAFHAAMHGRYADQWGPLDQRRAFGALFASRLGIQGSPPGGPVPPVEPPPPAEKPCPQVSSLNEVPNGAVVQTCDTGRVYKMVGGAPLWMTTCAGGLCPGTAVKVTQGIVNAGRAYPWDGATIIDEAGGIFKFVGGAPIHLASCNVGCGSPIPVPAGTIRLTDPGNHMRQNPADGATAIDDAGAIFKFAGGAPIHLATCDPGCGRPVPINAWSVGALDHMNPVPADNATVIDEQGGIFKFAGGAPIHLATCTVGCGNPVPITTWSIYALEHMRPFPADGATIRDEAGGIFKFVGGAPIHLANCAVGCGNAVQVNTASVVSLDHMYPFPADSATAIDEAGGIFKFVGGAPVHLASCAVGCGNPVPINGTSIMALDHMRPAPRDGVTMRTEIGDIFKFVGGAPIRLNSCNVNCGNQVQISGASIAALDHMRPNPYDGATAVTEGQMYKFVGGAPLKLSSCNVGCGAPAMINQWSVDVREHMNQEPPDRTVMTVEDGRQYTMEQHVATLVGFCGDQRGCGSQVVNRTSLDDLAVPVTAGQAWADFDGDGKADYCRRVGITNGTDSRVACTLSTGNGFGTTITSAVTDWGYPDGRAWVDFNGDGKADYCRRAGITNGTDSRVVCTLSAGGAFGASITSPVTDWGYAAGRAWVDANGDGKADFCRVVGVTNGTDSRVACTLSAGGAFGATITSPVIDWGFPEGRIWADFNGDGKADFCRRAGGPVNGTDSRVVCTLSTGGGFGASVGSDVLDWGYAAGWDWKDMNGDGKADYCRVVGMTNGANSRVACTLSTGTAFGTTITSDVIDWGYPDGRAWADADGDGKADFCRRVGVTNGTDSRVSCTLSAGGAFGQTIASPVVDWGYVDGRGWRDADGDGKADFCRKVGITNGTDSRVSCTLSTGNGFGQTFPSAVTDWGYAEY